MISQIRRITARLFADHTGLSTVELGIILSLVVIAGVPALSALGGSTEQTLNSTSNKVAEYAVDGADPFALGTRAQEPSTPGLQPTPGGNPQEPSPARIVPLEPANDLIISPVVVEPPPASSPAA